MSLNTRVGFVLLGAAALSPLWLPVLPLVLWWLRRERVAGRRMGLHCLPRYLARTIEGYAEATLPSPPPGGFQRVAHNVDRYLAAVHSPRHWRTFAMLSLLAFLPCALLRRPFFAMPLDVRRRFVERHLSTTRGLRAAPSLARQLVRMGYYADPHVAQQLGFLTMHQRARRTPRTERFAVERAVG